jgi:hypothetical protein
VAGHQPVVGADRRSNDELACAGSALQCLRTSRTIHVPPRPLFPTDRILSICHQRPKYFRQRRYRYCAQDSTPVGHLARMRAIRARPHVVVWCADQLHAMLHGVRCVGECCMPPVALPGAGHALRVSRRRLVRRRQPISSVGSRRARTDFEFCNLLILGNSMS